MNLDFFFYRLTNSWLAQLLVIDYWRGNLDFYTFIYFLLAMKVPSYIPLCEYFSSLTSFSLAQTPPFGRTEQHTTACHLARLDQSQIRATITATRSLRLPSSAEQQRFGGQQWQRWRWWRWQRFIQQRLHRQCTRACQYECDGGDSGRQRWRQFGVRTGCQSECTKSSATASGDGRLKALLHGAFNANARR